jgi:FkbM family methyltransferase
MNLAKRIQSSISARYKEWRFRPYVIDRAIAGEKLRFLIGDTFGEGWYGPQHDLSLEYEWIKARGIAPGDVVVDCGANHGFSTTLFSRWTGPLGTVHAFEPYPPNLEILRTNLELNRVDNVRVHPIALGAENGAVNLSVHSNATIQRELKPNEPSETVPLRRLDDELGETRVDFIKVDVEGFELELLKGAQRILAGHPRLAIEVHVCIYKNKVEQLTELFDLIHLANYSVEMQPVTDGPIRPFDPRLDTPSALSTCHVLHLFCR